MVDKRELLDIIPTFHPHSKMLLEAPLATIVCADLEAVKYPEFWPQDCSAATQNILLTISEQNLGGVWIGTYPKEDRVRKLQEIFKMPETIIPFSIVAMGHPAEKKPPKNIFDQDRIRYNIWEKEL